MDHLSTEVLARLVDQGASEEEYRHLADCPACRAELDAFRDQTEALGRLPDLRPPPGDWSVLQARLVSEGLVQASGRIVGRVAGTPAWMRAAAAVILFLGGAAAGGAAARGPGLPFAGDRVAQDGSFLVPATDVASVDDAFQRVQLAERQYMDALVQYRQLREGQDGSLATADAESRYAALEYMVRAGQAALREAPTDPFLNGLVASTMAEREAWLRLISSDGSNNWF